MMRFRVSGVRGEIGFRCQCLSASGGFRFQEEPLVLKSAIHVLLKPDT
ncbi:hypothetical protein D3OALGB2SA_3751 [Olavius algarvensis associated proteobacterium Delta 3]|nr:hypothetical protein D3OALGB2SA_3751 [Olavius algarvensis associated proteobacterium Delta 3]